MWWNGRRDGLKIRWGKTRVSSSLTTGTADGLQINRKVSLHFFIRLCGKCSRHLHTNLMIRGWSSAEVVHSPYHETWLASEHGWLRVDPLFGSTFFDRGEMPFSFDSVYCWWMVTLWFGIDGSVLFVYNSMVKKRSWIKVTEVFLSRNTPL